MTKLSGKQLIDLSPSLLVEVRREDENINIEYSINEFLIKISFEINPDLGANINTDSTLGIYHVDRLLIVASKEVESTPEIPVAQNGSRDFTSLHPYFNEHRTEYSQIIKEAFRRVIIFFKYTLNQPFLDEVSLKNNKFNDIQWLDDEGHEYGSLIISFTLSVPTVNTSLEVLTFKKENLSSLLSSLLHNNVEVDLQQQILSDSQAALIGGNLRRGVFEMAVTCELSVKRTFFSQHSRAGDAFEYLEDKGKVTVSVLEFIGKLAKDVFGESFMDNHPDDYKCIDYLFRCRNKIAHRGELKFKDHDGSLQEVDNDMAKKWYLSVRRLLDWLHRQSAA